MWSWVAEIACSSGDRVGYRDTEPEAVGHRVRRHQADRRRAVRERHDSEMPSGTPLRVDAQLPAFIGPGAELLARAGALGDIEGGRRAARNPPVAGERQGRALDPPSQQPVAEVVLKAPQAVEADSAL